MHATIHLVAVVALCAASLPALAASNVESDRKAIVELAVKIEADPTSKKARDYRRKALTLINRTAGVRVEPCRALLGELLLSKRLGARELHAQLEIATARFLIEHRDASGNRREALLAGLEGVLRAYEAMRHRNPAVLIDEIEALRERSARGELEAVVDQALADCDR